MQSQDEYNRIQQLTQVDLGNIPDLAAKIKTAEEKGAVSHVIGKLPQAGQNVQINGLSYRVDFADFVKGKFQVKLVCRDK
jgi:Mg2+/Co2+ transporter CorC